MKNRGVSSGLLLLTTTSLIFALIFFVLSIFSSENDSEATILDLFSGERSQTARFSDVLVRLGHEKPRPYRLNGNNVFISVRHSFKDPLELVNEYQVAFTDEGLNKYIVNDADVTKNVHYALSDKGSLDRMLEDESLEKALSALNGGIIPIELSGDYVRMVGSEPVEEVKDFGDIFRLARLEPEKMFKAVRTVEMFKKDGGGTTVVATFSDDKLDISKMFKDPKNMKRAGRYHENLPACPTCTRVQQFEDLDPDSTFIGNVYVSDALPSEILSYYDGLYTNRGWKSTGSNFMLEKLSQIKNKNAEMNDELFNSRVYVQDNGDVISLAITPAYDNLVYVDLKYTRDLSN